MICPYFIFKLEVVSRISSNDFICKGHFTCHKECHSACENIFLMSSLALKGAFRKSEKITKSAGLSRIGLGEYKFQPSRKAFGYRSGWTWDFERHLPGRESLRKDASELHFENCMISFFYGLLYVQILMKVPCSYVSVLCLKNWISSSLSLAHCEFTT